MEIVYDYVEIVSLKAFCFNQSFLFIFAKLASIPFCVGIRI